MAKIEKQKSEPTDPVAVVEQPVEVAKEVTVPPAAVAEAPSVAEAAEVVLPKFKVTLDEKSDVIDAANADEAWAMFCDKHKHWPNPKTCGRTIEQVK